MNVLVASVPLPMRNSLILTGLVLRTRSDVEADRVAPPWSVHEAVPAMSPLNTAGPEVTRNVRLTLSPGATGPAIVSEPPWTAALHWAGSEMPSLTVVARPPDVFVNVTIVSWLVPGANVCRPGGPFGVRSATATVPSRWLPDESTRVVPPASSNL